MLIGDPGARKGTAINTIKKVLSRVGYDKFAAERTTKEKFLLDLEGKEKDGKDVGTIEDILGDLDETQAHDVFVAVDEFVDFVGFGNLEFLSMLGSLWTYDGMYQNRIKHGRSVKINNPTVSLLGGATHTTLSLAFPPETMGQGFMSRLILVYGERQKHKRVTFPPVPTETEYIILDEWLSAVRDKVTGIATTSPDAHEALDKIYMGWEDLDDQRFKHYSSRRFTHLLKLCMICAACRVSTQINMQDVLLANTILSYTESTMSKALGEFGKSRHSEVSGKIMNILYEATRPVTISELWKQVSTDLEKLQDLSNLLQGLSQADKIFVVKGAFLPRAKKMKDTKFVDFSLLAEVEDGI